MLLNLNDVPTIGVSYDLIVVGAGGAGMTAALVAALEGRRVLLVERTAFVGGTTAWAAGTTWIPGTRQGASVAPEDSIDAAETFLTHAVGERSDPKLRRVFLERGREAVDYVEQHSDLQFRPFAQHPDYLSELDGAVLKGRALDPVPFDGRTLGNLFGLLRPPIPEFTVLGGMMVDRNDIFHLLRLGKSFASFSHGMRIVWRHLCDRLRYPRGTRLVMGNALAGRLLLSLSKCSNLSLALDTSFDWLHQTETGVRAVTLTQRGVSRTFTVHRGVILASGGFNRHAGTRAQLLPGMEMAWSVCAPADGAGAPDMAHKVARMAGACYGAGALSHAFWAPSSMRRRKDGSTAVFPHFVLDRSKPGTLAVNAAGRRFVNESTSYHRFGLAMQEDETGQTPNTPAWLIADADALRKYGLGMVRPGGKGLAPFLADGYLTQGATLDELARRFGIDADGLQDSVARMNRYAETGVDQDFARGSTAYERHNGDAAAGFKNPCLGPIRTAPFYALKFVPGDIGAATGFVTDEHARILDEFDQPIPGLYAVGNDMHSIMGGVYPAPGITLGPALVFGYIAARHAAQRNIPQPGETG